MPRATSKHSIILMPTRNSVYKMCKNSSCETEVYRALEVSSREQWARNGLIIVGWPATQNINFNSTLQSMKFYCRICSFGCLSFGKLMMSKTEIITQLWNIKVSKTYQSAEHISTFLDTLFSGRHLQISIEVPTQQ